MTSSPRPAARGLALALVAALAGCVRPATELLVTLDTDTPADRAIALAVVVRAGPDGGSAVRRWRRDPGGTDGIAFPASFAVVPRAGGARDEEVVLEVEVHVGAGPAGEPELDFRRVVRTRFAPQQTSRVRVFLSVACGVLTTGCRAAPAEACTLSAYCEEHGLTCGERGACVMPDVAPRVDPPDVGAAPDAGSSIDAAPDAPVAADAVDAADAADGAPVDDGAAGDGCVRNCSGRQCGSDGCGGTCGTCATGQVCSTLSGTCCTPNCGSMECGPNGCGGSCGRCLGGERCRAGFCEPVCSTCAPP
jgi:hypothetical protein